MWCHCLHSDNSTCTAAFNECLLMPSLHACLVFTDYYVTLCSDFWVCVFLCQSRFWTLVQKYIILQLLLCTQNNIWDRSFLMWRGSKRKICIYGLENGIFWFSTPSKIVNFIFFKKQKIILDNWFMMQHSKKLSNRK